LPAGPPLGLSSPFPASLIFLPWVNIDMPKELTEKQQKLIKQLEKTGL